MALQENKEDQFKKYLESIRTHFAHSVSNQVSRIRRISNKT